jgi:presenilin-like A22 family membrane protease
MCDLSLSLHTASMMVRVAIERFQIAVDVLTFYGGMYNFAIVGVVSIFGGPYIVPSYVNQGYLILTSVIVAWQLSHLQPFLAWVLLVLLALYDLFAVLTPCGPLKALVNLMSKDDAPSMPGLLYEASLPVSLPPRGNRVSTNNDNGDSAEADNNRTNRSIQQGQQHQQQQQSSSHSGTTSHENVRDNRDTAVGNEIPEIERCPSATVEEDPDPDSGLVDSTTTTAAAAAAAAAAESSDGADESIEASPLLSPNGAATIATDEGLIEPSRISRVPLALAKVYKLRFLHDPQPPWILSTAAVDAAHTDDASTNDDNAATATSTAANVEFTPEQLCELVDVVFPRNGGRIVPTLSLENANVIYRRTAATDETRYTVIGSRGEHRRVLFINNEGRIFEDLRESNAAEERKERTSIRLGLGDFIFYSILVSKAALFSFTTFAVCTLAVLSGLGLTLLLLAVYGAALPALPVSIALGVVFYLFTRFIMEPWVEAVFTERVYV